MACWANNILVLDIDEKNEGLDEWNKYISEYNEPLIYKNTSCLKSISKLMPQVILGL